MLALMRTDASAETDLRRELAELRSEMSTLRILLHQRASEVHRPGTIL
jgi:hypothetical protein